ncbi:MAG: hypothetical protein ABL949_14820 [Fimbriimonadaceae bacterium]
MKPLPAWITRSVLTTVVSLFLGIVGYGYWQSKQPYRPKTLCLSNVKQFSKAMLMYAESNNDTLPKNSWVQPLMPIIKSGPDWSKSDDGVWSCPDVLNQNKHGGYAMNSAVMGKRLSDFEHPETIVTIFETDALGIDVITNLAARSGRHNGGSQIGCLDGHARFKKLGETPGEKLNNPKTSP